LSLMGGHLKKGHHTNKLRILLSVLTQYLKKEKSASVFMPGKKDSYIRSSLSDNVHQ